MLATTDIGKRHHHLAVEAARAQQRRVEHIGTVGGGDDDDAFIGLEAIHLDQQLVQRLLALVVAAAHAGAARTTHGIDLVDEDDAGCLLLGLLEHVAHTGSTHTDEHLDEVGAGDREERHLGLAGDGLRQQGLAGTGRPDHQDTAGDGATQPLELGRITQEVDQFLDFLLGLVTPRHVGKGGLDLILGQELGLGLAEAHGAALAGTTALHLAHEEHEDGQDQQNREARDQ